MQRHRVGSKHGAFEEWPRDQKSQQGEVGEVGRGWIVQKKKIDTLSGV